MTTARTPLPESIDGTLALLDVTPAGTLFQHGVQRHGQQGDGHLLAGGHDHIQLTRQRLLVATDGLGQFDQAIGLAAHGRQHYDQVVTGIAEFLNLVGHLLDSFDRADRGASKFLYDQSHF